MGKLSLADTDYSVVVKHRVSTPNPWRWEIYRAGRSSPIGQSPIFFGTVASANKAGKVALKELLADSRANGAREKRGSRFTSRILEGVAVCRCLVRPWD